MVSSRPDSVSNIHKRWTITRLNPSSYKISVSISIASAALIVTLSFLYGLDGMVKNYVVSLVYGLIAILALSFLDYLSLHGAPTNKISKMYHVAAFGNLLWLIVLAVGIAFDSLFGYKSDSDIYLLEGMLIVVGFRISIFTSVIGAGLVRAVCVSFIGPVLFLVILLTPSGFYDIVLKYSHALVISSFFVIWAVIWSILADKAGRPYVLSTFNLLQAFLSAWTEQKGDRMEEIVEARAEVKNVTSYIMKFYTNTSNQVEISLVIPGVHPGPFKPIGGSNLPYELLRIFSTRALVVHSASDHSFNIPSKNELTKYLNSFSTPFVFDMGSTCTEPIQIQEGGFIVTAIAFGRVCLIILSTRSQGMEDIPPEVASNLQDYASKLGFSKILAIDSHNAMGGPLSADDKHDLILCAREALDKIKVSVQYRFGVGFAAKYRFSGKDDKCIAEDNFHVQEKEDLGQGGLGVIAFEVMNKKYAIGWADSNNMENQVRAAVISDLKSHGFNMIEICTSDTHSTSGKRTRHGYYSLGSITSRKEIAGHYRQLAAESFAEIKRCSYRLLSVESNVKLMGKGQFDDYSQSLDRSMNLTKIFLAIAAAVAFTMLILT
jgi:putative membrane protein